MKIYLDMISAVEEFQWSMFNAATHISFNSSVIPASNLTEFSNEKHMEIDGEDDNFVRGIF